MAVSARLRVSLLAAAGLLALAGWLIWRHGQSRAEDAAFASGNGRLEALEINVASRLPGRVQSIAVQEGQWVEAGQVIARMDVANLNAQRDEALAKTAQAREAVGSATAQVAVAEGQWRAAQALVQQRVAERDAARSRLSRMESLAARGVLSRQALDDDRLRLTSGEAALAASQAQAAAAQAGIVAARAQVSRESANVAANQATVARIDADIADSILIAPRAGRVQYRVAEAGEVVGAGGVVVNVADLSEVFMTFFLPETQAGRVALGAEVRIVLDVAPDFVIPARVSFVASIAQFTPKTVETASERQKLMFRVKAQVDPALLQRYREQVKTGLPGVAWVRLDPRMPWPAHLALRTTP